MVKFNCAVDVLIDMSESLFQFYVGKTARTKRKSDTPSALPTSEKES